MLLSAEMEVLASKRPAIIEMAAEEAVLRQKQTSPLAQATNASIQPCKTASPARGEKLATCLTLYNSFAHSHTHPSLLVFRHTRPALLSVWALVSMFNRGQRSLGREGGHRFRAGVLCANALYYLLSTLSFYLCPYQLLSHDWASVVLNIAMHIY